MLEQPSAPPVESRTHSARDSTVYVTPSASTVRDWWWLESCVTDMPRMRSWSRSAMVAAAVRARLTAVVELAMSSVAKTAKMTPISTNAAMSVSTRVTPCSAESSGR